MYTKEEIIEIIQQMKKENLQGKSFIRKDNEKLVHLMKISTMPLVYVNDIEGVTLNIEIFIEVLSRLYDKKIESILEDVRSSHEFVSEN